MSFNGLVLLASTYELTLMAKFQTTHHAANISAVQTIFGDYFFSPPPVNCSVEIIFVSEENISSVVLEVRQNCRPSGICVVMQMLRCTEQRHQESILADTDEHFADKIQMRGH